MATLPNYVQFLATDYSESLDYRIRRSEMENGLSKQRPGRTKPLRVRKGKLLINTKANKVLFENWLKTIGNGTGWFTYVDPINGTKQCRFINSNWNFSQLGSVVWVVDCEMESIG